MKTMIELQIQLNTCNSPEAMGNGPWMWEKHARKEQNTPTKRNGKQHNKFKSKSKSKVSDNIVLHYEMMFSFFLVLISIVIIINLGIF